jgi:hypothetical protein
MPPLGGGGLEELTGSAVQAAIDSGIAAALDAQQRFQFGPLLLENPVNSDWYVDVLAPAAVDSIDPALTVRLFDDTIEEGVGFQFVIPDAASSMTIAFISRAEVAPPGTRQVGLELAERGVTDNTGIGGWNPLTLTDIDLPNNNLFQYDSQTITLATLGATAGELTQFELVRVAPVGTNLTGDWALAHLSVAFT